MSLLALRNISRKVRQAFVCLLCLGAFAAQAQPSPEDKLKAVFIYNFVNFVEWPATSFQKPTDPLVIGVSAPETFHELLTQVVSGETYLGRPIKLQLITNAEQARGCHLVYVDNDKARAEEILKAIENETILTIGDTDDFIRDGGVIRFYKTDNKVKFEINSELARNHNLKISAKLLRLASTQH